MSKKTHRPLRLAKPHTDDWYRDREVYDTGEQLLPRYGASEAAGVCGYSDFQEHQPRAIYERKIGIIEGRIDPLEGRQSNVDQQRGLDFEDAIKRSFAREHDGEFISDVPMLLHPTLPFMSATPDGLKHPGLDGKKLTLVSAFPGADPMDAKSTHIAKQGEFGESGTDQVPESHLFQAQQQMAVCGSDVAYWAVLFPSYVIKYYVIPRSDDLISAIISAEIEMTQRIINRDPPEHNWQHPGAYDLVMGLKELDKSKECYMTGDLAALARSLVYFNELSSQADAAKRAIKARLAYHMGDAEIAHVEGMEKVLKHSKIKKKAYEVEARTEDRLQFVNP